ncbi:unnamed protein product, partial [Ixodes persulcatus]
MLLCRRSVHIPPFGTTHDSSRLQDPVVRMYLEFLEFVLPIFIILNRQIQSEPLQIHALRRTISDALRTILDCYLKSRYLASMPVEDVKSKNPLHFCELKEVYLGAKNSMLASQRNRPPALLVEGFGLRCINCYIESAQQIYSRFAFEDPATKLLEMLDPRNVSGKK